MAAFFRATLQRQAGRGSLKGKKTIKGKKIKLSREGRRSHTEGCYSEDQHASLLQCNLCKSPVFSSLLLIPWQIGNIN